MTHRPGAIPLLPARGDPRGSGRSRRQRDAALPRIGPRVKSKPPRDRAASVRQLLLNLAKERGEEFNFVLLRFSGQTAP